MPSETPVTVPPPSTVAIVPAPLLHVPPAVGSENNTVPPAQTNEVGALMGNGPTTVTGFVTEQTPPAPYVIVAVPVAIPVTVPPEFTEATVASLVVQVPPGVTSDKSVVAPTQTLTGVEGVIDAGVEMTVTVKVVIHGPMAYIIVATPVDVPPVTTPLELTVAIDEGAVVLHMPPGIVSVSVSRDPVQTLGLPVIGLGLGETFTVVVTVQPGAVL